MELKELRKALAAEAKEAGICQEWLQKIKRAPSRDSLLRLFLRGLDFAILNNFPSDKLAAEFNDIAPAYGVYINQPGKWTSHGKKQTVARGATVESVTGNFDVTEVYALRGSSVEIKATGYAIVYATVYEGAEVRATASDFAQIKIINRGADVETEQTGKATIKVITP